jgi:hypothetical protein
MLFVPKTAGAGNKVGGITTLVTIVILAAAWVFEVRRDKRAQAGKS